MSADTEDVSVVVAVAVMLELRCCRGCFSCGQGSFSCCRSCCDVSVAGAVAVMFQLLEELVARGCLSCYDASADVAVASVILNIRVRRSGGLAGLSMRRQQGADA